MVESKRVFNLQAFDISFFLVLLITLAVYSFSINIEEYADDSVVLYQAYSLEVPFQLLQWINLRYVGLKSFLLSNYFAGDTRIVHVVSTLIHVVNGLLIYFILRTLKFTRWAALGIVAVWLLHPLNSQAVIYMSQRFTLVCSFWVLCSLSLLFYTEKKIKEANKTISYFSLFKYVGFIIGSLICFMLALFSKQTAAFLPFFVLYYLLFFSSYKRFAIITLVVGSIGLFLVAYQSPNLIAQLDSLTRETQSYSRSDYFATQLHIICVYLLKALIPINLIFESAFEVIEFGSSLFYMYLSIHLALILILYLLYKLAKDKRVLFGVSFFYFGLLVESSFIPIQDLYFEHRMYLPLLGVLIVLCCICELIVKKTGLTTKALTSLFIVGIVSFSFLTIQRINLWLEPLAFHKYDYEQSPTSTRAMSSYAKELAKVGDKQQALELFLNSYNTEIKMGIMRQSNIVGLLTILIDLKYYQDALNLGRRAIKMTQGRPKLQALVYAHLALVYFEMKQCGFASGWSKKALTLDSDVGLAQQLIILCSRK